MAHLYQVKQTYYFRIRIPKDMIQWFGRSEFKRSLHTKALTSARRLVMLWAAKTEKLFTTIRAGLLAGIMTGKQIRKLVEDYIGYRLRLEDENRLDIGVSRSLHETEEGPVYISDRAEVDPEKETAREELAANNFKYISRRLDEFLEHKGVKVQKDSYEYKLLCRDIACAHIGPIHQINMDRDMGYFGDKYYLADGDNTQCQTNVSSEAPSVEVSLSELVESVVRFSDLITMYVEEREAKNDITSKSLGEFKTRMELFRELIGDPDVKALNRKLFVDCLNKAVRIPSRRKQLAEYRDMTMDELLSLDSVPNPLGIKTIRNHFSSLSTLLTWAEQNDYISKNPAKSLMPKDDRGDEELRIPYDDLELQKMVDALTEQRQSGDLQPFRWLIPMVSLFSGLRADEVCQLYKEDIREVDGVWVFDVNDKGDKKVKTKNSKRLVPIHPQILELGLLDYISNVDHERVWPELTLGSRGYSHNWTDWYGKFNRSCISNDPRKVFHSLRKSFANNLKQNMIHDTVQKELMGHDVQSLGMSVYSNKYEVQVLHKEILRLSFDLDVSGLKWTPECGTERLGR